MRLFAFIAIATASLMIAAAPAQAQDKIGVVDLQRALNEVDEGAAAKKALKKEFDQKQKQLDTRQAELKTLKDELDAQATMMTPEKKQEKVADLQRKLVEVQQLYMQLQQDLSKREGEVTAQIFQKMGVILGALGEEQGFAVIAEKSAVPFYRPALDVTNELIRRYNKSYGKKK